MLILFNMQPSVSGTCNVTMQNSC